MQVDCRFGILLTGAGVVRWAGVFALSGAPGATSQLDIVVLSILHLSGKSSWLVRVDFWPHGELICL